MENKEQQNNQPKPSNRIKPLDPQLVNRIAAGEIIQRPFNALKELIENCLDAGSTNISIEIKDGGLKLIQIQDNGCGIDKDDLKIICERFTTSKLKEFEDLKAINTFGFRGEALASISHVSRLTIITRKPDMPCAFKATYTDGLLTKEGIKPCASASSGTKISVEDLFYNSSLRRNALRSGSDEFAKIYDVVSRYAIHNYHVSFYLKRIGENSMDLKTTGSLAATKKGRCLENESYLLDAIALVHGNDIRKELERVSIDYDESFKFEMMAYMTNSKYTQLKQMTFILFINERLVDCQPIKKTLQNVFALYMPKNTNPFIYMNLTMNPNNIDVNIHPTKHEIRFLYQDDIIQKIQKCFEDKLLNSNVSRTHYVKNLTLDTFMDVSALQKLDKSITNTDSTGKISDPSQVPEKIYPYQLTRVDSKERKIDSFFHQTSLNESLRAINKKTETLNTSTSSSKQDTQKSALRNQKLPRTFNFKSLSELRDRVERHQSKILRQVFQDMSFVGCLDREMALIQHQTGLFILNTHVLSNELFYQICIFNFGNFGYFRLEEPLPIADLAIMALNDPITEWTPDDGPKEKLARRCAKFLYSKATMLEDFFSIKINKIIDEETKQETIVIEALPMLIEDYEPDLVDLPLFLIRLATEVEWSEEKPCFDTISKEIATFYSIKNLKYTPENEKPDSVSTSSYSSSQEKPDDNWIIEHVFYNSFRSMLLPSSKNEQQTFFKLVDLSKLYKVFERC